MTLALGFLTAKSYKWLHPGALVATELVMLQVLDSLLPLPFMLFLVSYWCCM